MGATFWVYAGGSWRQLDVQSGRVAGWAGRAGFCYRRRGRLRLAGASAVLRGLRRLQGLLPGTVRDGLPLIKQRRHNKVKKQSCCCSHHGPAQPSNALVQLNLSTQCATATQTSLPPPQPVKSDAAVQVQAPEPREEAPGTSATSAADDDAPVFKELVVQEEDVSALRSLIVRGGVFPFPVDLYRFDSDDRYKSNLFYRINPLVSVARCARIREMYRHQQSQKSLREFTRVLGLRAVSDKSPHKSPHKSPNKLPHKLPNKLHNKSSSEDSDFINNYDSDFESETSKSVNKYKTALRSRKEDRNKNQRSKRNTITRSYFQSSDETSSIKSNRIDTNRRTDRNLSKNDAKSIDRETSKDRGTTNNEDDSPDSDDSRSILNPFKSRTTRDKEKNNDHKSSKDRQREDESKENRSNKRKYRDSSDEGGGRKGRNVSFSDQTVGRVARNLDRDAEKRRRSQSSSPTKSIDSRSRHKQTDTRRPLRDSSQETVLNNWADRNGTAKHKQNDKHKGPAKKPLHLNQRRNRSGRFLPMKKAKKSEDNTNRNQLEDSKNESESMERRVTRLNNVERSDVNDNNIELKRLRSDLKNVDKIQNDLNSVDKLQSDSSSVDKIQRHSSKKTRSNKDAELNDSRSPEVRVTRLNNTKNSSNANEKSVERRVVRSDLKSVDKLQSDSSSADKIQSDRKGEVSVKGDSRSESKAGSSKDAGKRNEKRSKQWSVASSQDSSGQLRREYSSLEDHCIVQWLSLGARARKVNGNMVWRELQSEFSRLSGRSRSWHSLRNRYLRSILPALGSLALPPSRVAALRAAQATGEIKSRRAPPRPHPLALPRVRSAWALRPRSDVEEDIQSSSERVEETAPKSKEKRALRSSHTDTHSVSHTDKHRHTDKTVTQIALSPTYSELTRRFATRHAASTPEVEISRHGSVSPPAKRTRRLYNPNSKI